MVSGSAGPPTWRDGSLLSISSLGLGCLYLQWPYAQNNVYRLIGYKVLWAPVNGQTAVAPVVLFDGTGYPQLREYVACNLTPGDAYQFFIEALNEDPATLQVFSSTRLYRTFTLSSAVGPDPTVLSQSSFSAVAGVLSQLPIQGIQPSTGLHQTIGPVCLVTQEASCIPGRTFVAFLQPLCELTALSNDCSTLRESSTGWSSELLAASDSYVSSPSVAFDPLNNGNYIARFLGTKSGEFSLSIQAVTPGQILGLYWDNAFFEGDPVDTQLNSNIDFAWGLNPPVQWMVDFISVRWLGYLNPISDGQYTVVCVANSHCNVWINAEKIISSSTSCENGCVASHSLSLKRSTYYRIRVDYVTGISQNLFVHLNWKDEAGVYPEQTAVPSEVFQQGSYITGSPFRVTVSPGPIAGRASFVYGGEEALFNPFVGKRYTLFVQATDAYGNACLSFNARDLLVAQIFSASSSSMIQSVQAVPYDPASHDCVYAFGFAHSQPGLYLLSVLVNGEAVSNSPISQSVSLGPVASLIIQPLMDASVNVLFSVQLIPIDAFGNVIPFQQLVSSGTPISVRYRLYKDPALVSSLSQCGSRSSITWLIYCWGEEFVYTDDSLLNQVPTFSEGLSIIDLSTGTLQIPDLRASIAGDHLLDIYLGDSPVQGSPLSLRVGTGSDVTNPVDPSMCLVLFTQPSSSAEVVAFDTSVNALVLLRDEFGNAITDRDNAIVVMSFTKTVNRDAGSFPCTYVPGKYYSCSGYSALSGIVSVMVSVNQGVASMTTGTPPSDEVCIAAALCGTLRCPCMQQRVPASLTLHVVPGE